MDHARGPRFESTSLHCVKENICAQDKTINCSYCSFCLIKYRTFWVKSEGIIIIFIKSNSIRSLKSLLNISNSYVLYQLKYKY